MRSEVLPKKRGPSHGDQRNVSGSIPGSGGPGRINSNRVLSKRNPNSNSTNTGRVLSNRVISGSRHVSRSLADSADLNDSFGDENAIHFNENKHTILSNFEEWIKLSTDNKITSKNSWQFALIDYFHDLNVIKDGENINFQRASATLDGCVKIYSSRVESAATETGKLLSGLAKKQDTENAGQQEAGEEQQESEDEDAEDDGKKKRKYNRVVESTLVDFEAIQIKKLEQELSIDPLFKKALAEFDEGGAKSLLLNTLNIDSSGRVIFDATSNSIKESPKGATESEAVEEENIPDDEIDLTKLEHMVFKDSDLDTLAICPSLNEFKSAIEDISKAKSILDNFNTKINEEETPKEEEEEDVNQGDYGFDDFEADAEDDPEGNGEPNDYNDNNDDNDPINNLNQSIMQQIFNSTDQYIQTTTKTQVLDRDLMAYFDEKMNVNWRGPEHWKVSALRKTKNLDNPENPASTPSEVPKKKKNQQLIIDFFDEEDDNEDLIFEPPKVPSSILLKKSEGDVSKNLLPDDIKYNSSRLTNLFTKPQVHILYFPSKEVKQEGPQLTDENFFAQQYHKHEEEEQERLAASFHQAEYDDYNNDFGGDDNYGGIDFNDALEGTENKLPHDDKDGIATESQVLGRKRPENITFSRVAKRVDIKLLKDNLWNTIKKEERSRSPTPALEDQAPPPPQVKTFGNVITSIADLYGAEQRKDLSTSFCFICLLHLANEHGLDIVTNDLHNDLRISGF